MTGIQKRIGKQGFRILLLGGVLLGLIFPGKLKADDTQQLRALQALNQIAVSLTHIIAYNDRVVLDQEYNTIINNLNLSRIPDGDIITLLQELMDLLANSKIQDLERKKLEKTYEENIQSELKNRVRNRILAADPLTLPYTLLSQAVLSAGSFYFNYRDQIDGYQKEISSGEWKIRQQTLQDLNNFYKKLLKHSWDLMQKYNFPDEWRLGEKQLTDYTAILREKDPALRYRKLERLEPSFQKFPPYWYYRGVAAQEMGSQEEAFRCFTQFQSVHQGLLRKDPYVASAAMGRIMLLPDGGTKEQIAEDLERIVANSEDSDWANILFAAIQYARLGDADMSGKLILRNLDNGFTAFLQSPELVRVVAPALLKNARPDVFARVMALILANDKVKNYDLLSLYGAIGSADILKKIEPEFNRMLLVPSRGDSLSLYLPTRWTAENVSMVLSFMDETGTRDFRPRAIALLPDAPGMTLVTFKDVFSVKSFLKKKRAAKIHLSLVRTPIPEDRTENGGYEMELFFRSEIIPSGEQHRRVDAFSRLLPKAGGKSPSETKAEEEPQPEVGGDPTVWFAKDKILMNGEPFGWDDGGVILP